MKPRRGRRRGGLPLADVDPADVYRELAPAVLGYVRSQGAPDPEDLLGEIFLQVVRDLPRFRGDVEALRRWVFTVAHHRIIDSCRQERRRPAAVVGTVPDIVAPAAAEPFDEELHRALHLLTPEQREVVGLRFVADLPLVEVATLTGRSVAAVKALQHRALETLAEILGIGRARSA